MVYVRGVPATTGSGDAVFPISRSALASTRVSALAVLFDASSSAGTLAVTVASLWIVPVKVGSIFTTMVKVADDPGASDGTVQVIEVAGGRAGVQLDDTKLVFA